MRIGMVCPYSFDVPGGVQSHVLQLAEAMRARHHDVSVLAPSSPHVKLPDYVASGGKAVPIPYNGSVARLRLCRASTACSAASAVSTPMTMIAYSFRNSRQFRMGFGL